MSFRRWVLPQLDKEQAALLAEDCEINPFLALLLTTRGITEPEAVAAFLLGGEIEDDPFAFADMDAAADRVQRAIDLGEPITIYGDYDADGVTSTVLLYTYLKGLGAVVSYYIPQREGEGYGLHKAAIDKIAAEGARLLVTVDNGIAAAEEIAYARECGLDVVVTDHHMPQETLPQAAAVVDPHRPDCGSVQKDYAGVGVAFKLACALEGDTDAVLERYADLVALGTLADVMPLTGENRELVRRGLRQINEQPRLGLKKLAEAAGMGDKTHTATTAVFTLAPHINAAGRMGSPDVAARLLLSEQDEEAAALAQQIQQLNIERQTAEAAILEQVYARLQQEPALLADRVLVIEGEGWHAGIVGIIASRVVDRYGKPCLILSVQPSGETGGMAKGSGRSVKGFSLFDALTACQEQLLAFGGHELAAGVTLEAERIGAFRRAINAYAAARYPVMPVPELSVDIKLRPSQANLEKCALLSMLEPFGTGNPVPLFGLFNMRLDNIVPVGGGKHLRLSVSREDARLSVMRFQTAPEEFPVECGAMLNLVVTLEQNEFRGAASLSLIARDIRYADTRQEDILDGLAWYDRVMRRELTEEERAQHPVPTREQIACVYRLLRGAQGWRGNFEQLCHAAGEAGGSGNVRLAVEVLCEAELVTVQDMGDRLRVTMCEAAGKADLNQTPTMRYLCGETAPA